MWLFHMWLVGPISISPALGAGSSTACLVQPKDLTYIDLLISNIDTLHFQALRGSSQGNFSQYYLKNISQLKPVYKKRMAELDKVRHFHMEFWAITSFWPFLTMSCCKHPPSKFSQAAQSGTNPRFFPQCFGGKQASLCILMGFCSHRSSFWGHFVSARTHHPVPTLVISLKI